MACNACSVSCKDWNGVNPGPVRWRIQKTFEAETVNYTNLNASFFPLSMACNHCEEPACKTACSVGAVQKRDDGVVYIDRDKCQNLQLCIKACPYATPKIAGSKQEADKKNSWIVLHPMQKCDFCRTRVDSGKQPICVAACPCHALDSGDYDDIMIKYPDAVRMSKTDFPYAYPNGYGEDVTKPCFLIKKRV
jgi:anaerobic dimethyl sulfoxide reductase subunit B (iron-sulfur subunit)